MESLLVLEDSPDVMNLVQRVLTRAGYTALEANSANQAERHGETNPNIALLVADVSPPCSGVAVNSRLKSLDSVVGIILTSVYPPGCGPITTPRASLSFLPMR